VKRLAVPITLALVAAMPAAAQTCSCQPEPLTQLVSRLEVVFDGIVESGPTYVPVRSAAARNARQGYQFRVHRVWKGDVGPTFTVAYPEPQYGFCGVALKRGEVMLVGASTFRQRDPEPNRPLEGDSCTVMNMNQPTLDYARELGSPIRAHRH